MVDIQLDSIEFEDVSPLIDVTEDLSEGDDDEVEDSPLKELYTGQTFISFEVLEQSLKRYSTKRGFNTKIVRVEKEDGVYARKTYKCRHGNKYEPKKKLDPTENRERESVCIECGFLLNASYRKRANLVYINKFIEEHNHPLSDSELLQQFAPSLRKITTDVKEEIKFFVQECHLGATVLKRILRKKFPDQEIYQQDLYNMIHKFKIDAQIKNDAVLLYEHLVKLQQEDSNWYFGVDFEGIDNRLSKIFWMSPDQKNLWTRFHDVVLNDNTCKTNKYSMPLSVFIVIDSDQRSRIVATAIVSDETVSTYEWILKETMLATGNLQPVVIFTDGDPAMQVAISTQYSETIVRHCAFHIRQNLIKKVKKKLHDKWDTFVADFYVLRNSLVVSDFDHRWEELMNKYPEIKGYCERVLYPTKECWAYAFTKRTFSANTHSTQRVESINRIIKLEANSGNTLYELQAGIELRLKDEAKYAKLQEFRNMNPTTGLPNISNTIFKGVDNMCKKYLMPNSLALQQKQILESLLYRVLLQENVIETNLVNLFFFVFSLFVLLLYD